MKKYILKKLKILESTKKIFLNHHPDIANKIKSQNNPNPYININEYSPNLSKNNNNFLNVNYSYSEINNYNESNFP